MSYQPSQPSQPTVYYTAPTPTVTYHNYESSYTKTTSLVLGIIEIILGFTSIAAGIMALIYEATLGFVGVGIWAGIIYVIAGCIAIAAGQSPSDRVIGANATASGLVIVVGLTHLIIASIGLSEDVYCFYYDYYDVTCATWKSEAVAANCLNIGAASWQIIFGCCLLFCSCRAIQRTSTAQTTTVHYATGVPQTVQAIPISTTQYPYAQQPYPPSYPQPYYPPQHQQQYPGMPSQQPYMPPAQQGNDPAQYSGMPSKPGAQGY